MRLKKLKKLFVEKDLLLLIIGALYFYPSIIFISYQLFWLLFGLTGVLIKSAWYLKMAMLEVHENE